MKKILNAVGCVLVVVAAGLVGRAYGLFKAPAVETAGRYGTAVVNWAKGGFNGSPTAGVKDPETEAAAAGQAAAKAKAELAQLVGESKSRAVAKYPDLAVANTEMNSRFVFRYGYLVKESSARLQTPTWPEELADECAADSKVRATPSGHGKGPTTLTNPKKMVASTGTL